MPAILHTTAESQAYVSGMSAILHTAAESQAFLSFLSLQLSLRFMCPFYPVDTIAEYWAYGKFIMHLNLRILAMY